MTRMSWGAIAAAAAMATGTAALGEGVTVVVPVEGIESWDELGEATNVVLTLDVADLAGFGSGTSVLVTGIGYELNLQTFMFSWLSEAAINFDDNDAPAGGVTLNPGLGDDMAGNETYTLPLEKFAPGEELALSAGVLRIEFFELFDDIPNEIDAEWNGTITLQIDLPAPGAAGLLAVAGVCAGRRRR